MSNSQPFTLSEAESKKLLERYGVPFAEERVAASASEATQAAIELGFPVALKLNGAHITHKTERDLVRLGLTNAENVTVAGNELLALATLEDGEVTLLVAPMIEGKRELIAGLATDPQFGTTVMVGVGGIFAEALADVSLRLVPISSIDAQEMISDLQAQTLLGEFRGEVPLDREALVEILMALSAAAVANPNIISADLNPLIVSNGRPVAVDALVEMSR